MIVHNRNLSRSGILALLAGLLWCCLAGMAMAHASLTGAVPPDGAVVGTPPKTLSLSFSEPVSPLVLKLIRPDGQAVAAIPHLPHELPLNLFADPHTAKTRHAFRHIYMNVGVRIVGRAIV